MAKEKDNKAKNDSDSQKTGNSCGFSLGCLVIIVAVLAIIFFIFLKPALENAGYSYGDLEDKLFDLRDKTSETLEKTDQLLEQGREKYENIKVTLFDGSYHDVDSSEIAFKIASSMAFKSGASLRLDF